MSRQVKQVISIALLPLFTKILIAIFIIVIIQSSLGSIGEKFKDWISQNSIEYDNESEAFLDWVDSSEDEELLSETSFNKVSLDSLLTLERNTYFNDINIDNSERDNYTVRLHDATYQYRFPWQIGSVITAINGRTEDLDNEDPYLTDMYEDFGTKYYGLLKGKDEVTLKDLEDVEVDDFKYCKTIKKKYIVITEYRDSEGERDVDRDEYTVIEKYPMPYFDKIINYLYRYNFNYEIETEKNTKTFSRGNKKRRITTTIITTTSIPVLKNINVANISNDFVSKLNNYDLAESDIEFLQELLEVLPYGKPIANEIEIAISGNIHDGSYDGSYDCGSPMTFNFVYPALSGEKTRNDIVNVAKSIRGLPYFWGGKYAKEGFNNRWGQLTKVTSTNSWSTGKKMPLGLDCSGFVQWAYVQVFGEDKASKIGGSSTSQWSKSSSINECELKPGDLGFYQKGGGKHVGIFIGRDSSGTPMFIHCAGRQFTDTTHTTGQVIISKNFKAYNGYPPVKFRYFRRVKKLKFDS